MCKDTSFKSVTDGSADHHRAMYIVQVCQVSSYLPFFNFISNRKLPIDRRTLLVLMKKYGQQAGLPKDKQQLHALKHSICTHILDTGEDIYFAKDWVGHKNIQNTTIYSRFSTATRDARARKLFASHRVV